ncbi:MAG: site-specific DNA-methyltransferase [Planctomycetota bacterium]
MASDNKERNKQLSIKEEETPIIDYKQVATNKTIYKIPNFKHGFIWKDSIRGHKIGCLDASEKQEVELLMQNKKTNLSIQDPPYNVDVNDEFGNSPIDKYITWCEKWVDNTIDILNKNSSLYIWLGADIRNNLQPLPDFVIMMRKRPVRSRNFITMRNQRGYGTQKNWMAVRQELLYYTKGDPTFNVQAEYTNIPKKTRGYYKKVNGKITENFERSKSLTIRAGNVWYDIQQVFYLMHENVEGCFAQKPLKSAKRIIEASSNPNDLVVDFFGHSGSTLLQAEISNRTCYTMDINPNYCKIMLARLLHYRRTERTGWGKLKILNDSRILVEDEKLLGKLTLFDPE